MDMANWIYRVQNRDGERSIHRSPFNVKKKERMYGMMR